MHLTKVENALTEWWYCQNNERAMNFYAISYANTKAAEGLKICVGNYPNRTGDRRFFDRTAFTLNLAWQLVLPCPLGRILRP